VRSAPLVRALHSLARVEADDAPAGREVGRRRDGPVVARRRSPGAS